MFFSDNLFSPKAANRSHSSDEFRPRSCASARRPNRPWQALLQDHVATRMLTGPSLMVGAGALISDAFFLIQSRAMLTL